MMYCVGKAIKGEKAPKGDETKETKAGVEGSKTPKGKGGGKGGEEKSVKSAKGAKSGKDANPTKKSGIGMVMISSKFFISPLKGNSLKFSWKIVKLNFLVEFPYIIYGFW